MSVKHLEPNISKSWHGEHPWEVVPIIVIQCQHHYLGAWEAYVFAITFWWLSSCVPFLAVYLSVCRCFEIYVWRFQKGHLRHQCDIPDNNRRKATFSGLVWSLEIWSSFWKWVNHTQLLQREAGTPGLLSVMAPGSWSFVVEPSACRALHAWGIGHIWPTSFSSCHPTGLVWPASPMLPLTLPMTAS